MFGAGSRRSALAVHATTDALTGIANPRAFDATMKQEWWKAVQAACPIALLMIDADLLKQYNDKNGHQAGDNVLRIVAAALIAGAPSAGALVARYPPPRTSECCRSLAKRPNQNFANARRLALRLQHVAHLTDNYGRPDRSQASFCLSAVADPSEAILCRDEVGDVGCRYEIAGLAIRHDEPPAVHLPIVEFRYFPADDAKETAFCGVKNSRSRSRYLTDESVEPFSIPRKDLIRRYDLSASHALRSRNYDVLASEWKSFAQRVAAEPEAHWQSRFVHGQERQVRSRERAFFDDLGREVLTSNEDAGIFEKPKSSDDVSGRDDPAVAEINAITGERLLKWCGFDDVDGKDFREASRSAESS